MSFDVAKKFFDMIIEATPEDNEYINPENSPGLIIEFIGGEPFLEIELIDKICDYAIGRMIELNHPWANRFMISICSNGVLYFDEKVQEFIRKRKEYLSFSISIDGNKQLHDACRIFPDGKGSYDIAIQGVKHYREVHHGYMGSKMTLAPSNIKYAYDAVTNLINVGYTEVHLNCVYEEGWTLADATVLYNQLCKIADYLIEDRERFDNIYLSIFDERIFRPKTIESNENWCGGTGAMISCDYKGDIYPCIRYMESSLGNTAKPLKIGNIYDGIMQTPEDIQTVKDLRAITRRSQSTDECFYCPIADGCSWCSAYNYQTFGTANKRATFICPMHKARALANAYLWNKGNRLYYPERRMRIYVPEEWALEIITKDQWDELKRLESYTEEDAKYATEFYKNPDAVKMPDARHIYDSNGLLKADYTNKASYAYSDIIDMDRMMKEGKDADIQHNPLFPLVFGAKLQPILESNNLYTTNEQGERLVDTDKVSKMDTKELGVIADEVYKYNLPTDELIGKVTSLTGVIPGPTQISEKVEGCTTCCEE
jgi:radical SAM peptide maturase (CXXX-repeat target family)